ncbi:peptidoglycan DD-metalloendopeptidase family protein [Kribbella sp. DT2]|uniref:M23 family metallopeptidase n=1 Tax=Kribbella sp. DT2 TaxID=3393427 RepID=UPI003CF82F5A
MSPLPLIPLVPPPPDAAWPLDPRPRIVRAFTPPPKPWLPGHRGIDLAGTPGQPVLSATPGTITFAGPVAGRSVVVVTQGPHRTTYEPVIPSLPTGTTVQQSQPIGHLSAAASHCAPATCLHWGLLEGKTYLNPLDLLPAQPVRLLPTPPAQPARVFPTPPAQLPTQAPTTLSPAHAEQPASPPDAHHSPLPTVIVTLSALATLGATILIRNH